MLVDLATRKTLAKLPRAFLVDPDFAKAITEWMCWTTRQQSLLAVRVSWPCGQR